MASGYHRLNQKLMSERDEWIIRLFHQGFKPKIIARQVRMEPSGISSRLQKLRLEGKLAPVGARNG